ncbi:RNA polymerase sigma-70 factor [Dinghuibacter silviterrae]|uniref:RNA polymerase sigma-70 factor (ECF subfamily) n=1 Tax=Dinghuibacter silviterrae TaxID=1539049 RepID=A0A4R8DI89_9BACT|nr:RNA polymerase sigma-70 factor [Dinghuibacter silviterrae]TDW96680.1 RNA polymerase sigma-70 factor (ECF subfamily) [Dinghuibacter silviterrae]
MSAEKIYSDRRLVEQISKGDENAFQQLFDRYNDRLLHYIYGIVKSKEISEEIVMDVFMKIWLGKDIVDRIKNFDAFLFRVAYNKSIDFLRGVSRDLKFRDMVWEEVQIASGSKADDQLLTREYENKLREAIGLLPPQRRLVYQLSREKGFSHLDIARQLQLSKHTVSNHVVESQRFIRAYLTHHLDITVLLAICAAESL